MGSGRERIGRELSEVLALQQSDDPLKIAIGGVARDESPLKDWTGVDPCQGIHFLLHFQ